jgi:hypothetical protein
MLNQKAYLLRLKRDTDKKLKYLQNGKAEKHEQLG